MNATYLISKYLKDKLPSHIIVVNHFYQKMLPNILYLFDETTREYIGAVTTQFDGRFSTNYNGFNLLNKTDKEFIVQLLYDIAFKKIVFPNYEEDFKNKILKSLNIANLKLQNTQDKKVFKLTINNQTLGTVSLKENDNFEISLNSLSTGKQYSNVFLNAYNQLFNIVLKDIIHKIVYND